MAFTLLLVLLTACAAIAAEDLSGQMMVFPEETDTAYVTLTTPKETISAATVCLRSFTELRRAHSLFSMSTSTASNAFLIFKPAVSNMIYFDVNNKRGKFGDLDYKLNEWQSICATWDSATGVMQLWLNGKPSVIKYIGGSNIDDPIAIVGQEQDSFGGGFSKPQSFVGMLCDVHMWNYVLSPCKIERYMTDKRLSPGNLINWSSLEYVITGRVLINNKQTCRRRKAFWKRRW